MIMTSSKLIIPASSMSTKYGDPICLPKLAALDPTLSGFDSGAAMAMQMQIINSKLIKGIGF
jgi:hypothetical protein